MIVVQAEFKFPSTKSTQKQRYIKTSTHMQIEMREDLTCIVIIISPLEISEVLNVSNVLCLDFLFEEILHVEEEDQRRVAEEGVVTDALEQI